MSKTILKNTIAKGTLNVFNIIVPLLIYPYIYRILSPTSVGKIDYSTTLFTYFSLLGLLGIYNYGLREISRFRNDRTKVNSIFKNLFVIGLISNTLVYILYLLFVAFFVKDPILRKIMYVQGFSIIGQIVYIEWMNEANENFGFITIKTIIIRIISVASIFLLVNDDTDYVIYVAITTATVILNNIVSFIHIFHYIDFSPRYIFSNLNLKPLIIPLIVILVLNNTNLLYTVADKTILGVFCPATEVAYYGIGQKVSEMIRILFMSLIYVTIPRMSYYLENDIDNYKSSIRKLMRITILIMAPVSFGLFALSDDIVLLFSGNQYLSAIPAMRIYSFRIIVLATEAIVYNQIIFLFRKEKFLMIDNALCGILNVISDMYLVYCVNINSNTAILTTILCEILFQSVCYIYIYKKLKIKTGLFKLYTLKYILLAAVFIPIVLIIKSLITNMLLALVCSIITCIIFYIVALAISKDSMAKQLYNRLIYNKSI